MFLIKNARIYSMGGYDMEKGCVLVGDDGKIKAVAESITEPGARVFDAKGGHLTPGFIEPHCHIGLHNEGMRSEGMDYNEIADPNTAQMRAIDSINARDIMFKEALEAGVTTLCTGPGSANVIGGQFVLLKNNGSQSVDDMIMRDPFALKVAFGENPKRVYGGKDKSPHTRMGTAAVLRQALIDTLEYMKKCERFKDDPEKAPSRNLKMESVALALSGAVPVKAHAHRVDDILTAIRIAKEFGFDYTLDHCTEGYLIADVLRRENAKVIIGPLLSDRSKVELQNLTYKAAKILYDAGVKFAMMTDSPVIPEQYLAVAAAIAVREGLPEYEALKSITINAAEILGIADRVGSIEPGKDADIAVFDRDPLDARARAVLVMVDGKALYGE